MASPPAREPSAPPATPGRHFAVAVLLARKGRHAQALAALERARARGACSAADALDLEARIHAQRGELLRAEAAWSELLRLAPGDGRALAGLAELGRIRRPRRWPWLAAGLLLAALALGALALARSIRAEARHAREEAAASASRLEAALAEGRGERLAAAAEAAARLEGLAAELRAVRSELAATTAAAAGAPTAAQLERELRRLSAEHRAALARLAAEVRRHEEAEAAARPGAARPVPDGER
jgi:hypothetical protein